MDVFQGGFLSFSVKNGQKSYKLGLQKGIVVQVKILIIPPYLWPAVRESLPFSPDNQNNTSQ